MSDLIRREAVIAEVLAYLCSAPARDEDLLLWDMEQLIRAIPAVQPGKEVMPDVPHDAPNAPDAAPASTDDAGGGATREEIAEALWIANMSGFVPQMRSRFADIESYNRNHWLMMADVAIEKIKGGKK